MAGSWLAVGQLASKGLLWWRSCSHEVQLLADNWIKLLVEAVWIAHICLRLGGLQVARSSHEQRLILAVLVFV